MSRATRLVKLYKKFEIANNYGENQGVLQIYFQWVKVPACGLTTRSVVSRKVANCEVGTEGSETAKSGTDEQERYKRLREKDEYPQQYDVRNQQSNADVPQGNFLYVDAAGIG